MSLDPHFDRSARSDGYYYSLGFRVCKTYRRGVVNGWCLERWNGTNYEVLGTFKTKKAARAYAGRQERSDEAKSLASLEAS